MCCGRSNSPVQGFNAAGATGQRSIPRSALENEAHGREGFLLFVFRIIENMGEPGSVGNGSLKSAGLRA